MVVSKICCNFALAFGGKTQNKAKQRGPGGGMVDALVSGASVERRASSSLVLGTKVGFAEVQKVQEVQKYRNQ